MKKKKNLEILLAGSASGEMSAEPDDVWKALVPVEMSGEWTAFHEHYETCDGCTDMGSMKHLCPAGLGLLIAAEKAEAEEDLALS